ncbi:hypothetical protein BIY28_03975 [Brenneria goodwinii]|nr:hypothetical protein BIY28_03975 [Brenneria goodwinii]
MIFSTDCWQVSHRWDARYPGYLIVPAKEAVTELSELSPSALSEMGTVLKMTEQLLTTFCQPIKVVFYKLGFSHGFNCHFHAAPVTKALLEEIAAHSGYSSESDGNDAILYLSCEYCERPLNNQERQVIALTVSRPRQLC